MAIHETLKKSIPDALRARDEVRLRTVRSLVTAMTNEVVAKKRKPDEYLNDDEALTVIKRAVNQRKDSIEQFEKASRNDLAEPEKAELAILNAYLPTQMSSKEIMAVVKAKMGELGIVNTVAAKMPDGRLPANASESDSQSEAFRGKFIGVLMKELKGRADGADVKAVVDNLLS